MASFKIIVVFAIVSTILVSGVSGFQSLEKIVGGHESSIIDRPYMVSLQLIDPIQSILKHLCGASIISTNYLLTAAHCYPGIQNLNFLYARMGSNYYIQGGVIYKIDNFIIHPDYTSNILNYDFALIKTNGEILLSPNIGIINLPEVDSILTDYTYCTVAGWGVTTDIGTSASLVLREIDLPVINQSLCKLVYPFLTSIQFCMGGYHEGGRGACFGDSGGPAVQNNIQYGVVSGVKSGGCTAPATPVIFAKITAVRSWITTMTGI